MSAAVPPSPLVGYLKKKRGKAAGVQKEFQKRLIRVDSAVIYWWAPSAETLAAQNGEHATTGYKGCLDLQANQCVVELEEDTKFCIAPASGHWMSGAFDGMEDGRKFVFDAKKSEHTRDRWVEVILEHLRFANAQWEEQEDEKGSKNKGKTQASGASKKTAAKQTTPRTGEPVETKETDEMQMQAAVTARSGHTLKAPQHWEFLEALFPTGRAEADKATRNQLFARMDVNGNKKLGLQEIKTVVGNMVRIPGIKEYTPGVQCAMKVTREALQMHGDYGREWVTIKAFRILLFFLKHYIQLWANFLEINENGDNRLDIDEFVAGAEQLSKLGVAKVSKSTFRDIDKGNPDYLRFDEFADFVTRQGAPKNLDLGDDDNFDDIIDKDEHKTAKCADKSQLYLDFKLIAEKLATGRDATSMGRRLAFWLVLERDSRGYLSFDEVSYKLSLLLPIPGISDFGLPVRMAFRSTREGLESEGEVVEGIGWHAFFSLVYHLRLYVELWVRFCIADRSGDRRMDREEFASVVGMLKDWGLNEKALASLKKDPESTFRLVDCDGNGHVRFFEFADWCMQQMANPTPSLAGDAPPGAAAMANMSQDISELTAQVPVIDWDKVNDEFPSDFSAVAQATRLQLFNTFDDNLSGTIVVYEVAEKLKTMLQIRIRDYTPAVRLAFADTLAALPPDDLVAQYDYCEEIGWRQFRVFCLFLVRYLELWIKFLSVGGASNDRRIGVDQFKTLLLQLKGWGFVLDSEQLTSDVYVARLFQTIVTKKSAGMTFTQFASWCMANSVRPDLHISEEEMKGGNDAVSGGSRLAIWLSRMSEKDWQVVQDKIRASNDLNLPTVKKSLSKVLLVPGLLSYEPPARLAFESLKVKKEIETDDAYGLDMANLPELMLEMRPYFELWVLFCAADASGRGSITRKDFASILPQLQEWGLQDWDAELTFSQIESQGSASQHRRMGSVVFEEFAEYCIQNRVQEKQDMNDFLKSA